MDAAGIMELYLLDSLTKEEVGSNYMILEDCFLSDPEYTVLTRHSFLFHQYERENRQKQSCLGRS